MGFSLELAIEIIENGESTAKISLNILIQHTNISEYEHYVGILKYSKKKIVFNFIRCLHRTKNPTLQFTQHYLLFHFSTNISDCRFNLV